MNFLDSTDRPQPAAIDREPDAQSPGPGMAKASLVDLDAELERRIRERTSELELANAALERKIAERTRAVQAASENEARFRDLVEESMQAIVVHRDGKPVFANRAYAAMFGCTTVEEILRMGSIAPLVAPGEMTRAREHWAAVIRDGAAPSLGEVRARRVDGSEFWVYTESRMVVWDGERAVQATLLDITARKNAEAQLRQAQKMEAIGHLTGGLAHDFNNLLSVVIANLDLLEEQLADDAENQTLVDAAIQAAMQGAALTRQLLAFSRQQPLAPQRMDVNPLIADTVKLLSRTLGEDIAASFHAAPDIWPVVVDPAQLGSAIANLATNARDAMPRGGKLYVETRNVTLDTDYAAANPGAVPGDYVLIAVSDTGDGMSSETLVRVFEPFFTTKPEGKGTGLGLSMVFGFIKQSDGHIKIYSELGSGTIIRIYLPRAQDDQARASGTAPEDVEPAASSGETILVVDDNPAERSSVILRLERLGYRTIAVDGAASALAVLKGTEHIDLLFTDIIMRGGMTGRELVREAAALRPGLKVLFTSGFLGAGLRDSQRPGVGELLLSKPYRRQELALQLRQALGRG